MRSALPNSGSMKPVWTNSGPNVAIRSRCVLTVIPRVSSSRPFHLILRVLVQIATSRVRFRYREVLQSLAKGEAMSRGNIRCNDPVVLLPRKTWSNTHGSRNLAKTFFQQIPGSYESLLRLPEQLVNCLLLIQPDLQPLLPVNYPAPSGRGFLLHGQYLHHRDVV